MARCCRWVMGNRKRPASGPGLSRQATATVHQFKVRAGTELPFQIHEEDWGKYAHRAGLLFPTAPLKFRWDLVLLCLIVYSSVAVPFRLGMGHKAEDAWWLFEVAISIFFLFDLVFCFFTAAHDGDQFILDKHTIRARYLRSWFLIDALSAIPLELLDAVVAEAMPRDDLASLPGAGSLDSAHSGTSPAYLKVLRAARLLRLLRLLRLFKLQSYINLLEDALNINLAFLQLGKMVATLLYLMHVLGCGWFFLASKMPEEERTWVREYDGGAAENADVWVQYLYSIYWALMTLTTVGYGDITPVNDAERAYTLVVILIAAFVFGYLLSNVAEMIKNTDPNAVAIENKLEEVKVCAASTDYAASTLHLRCIPIATTLPVVAFPD